MRKALLVTLVVAGSLAFGSSTANAAWADCGSFRCVNKKLNALHNQVQNLKTAVFTCEQLVPVASYGDPSGSFGYVFNNEDGLGDFYTSALDYAPSSSYDELMIVDVCTSVKASAAGAKAGGLSRKLAVPDAGARRR